MGELVPTHASFKLLKDYIEQGNLVIEEMFLVNEMLDSINKRAIEMINNNVNDFIDILKQLVKTGLLNGCTW